MATYQEEWGFSNVGKKSSKKGWGNFAPVVEHTFPVPHSEYSTFFPNERLMSLYEYLAILLPKHEIR
jgi:hypothetical protein